jgi:hypothetical protein
MSFCESVYNISIENFVQKGHYMCNSCNLRFPFTLSSSGGGLGG